MPFLEVRRVGRLAILGLFGRIKDPVSLEDGPSDALKSKPQYVALN